MGTIRENARRLYENRRRGVSLVIAMCASAVIFGLALGVIRSGYLLLDRAGRKVERERCCQLAQSFAEVLEAKLRQGSMESAEAGDFYTFVDHALETGETVRCQAEGPEGYGVITVTVRPSGQTAEAPAEGGSFSYSESAAAIARIEAENSFLAEYISIETAAALERESYACSTVYCRKDSFQPRFFWNDTEEVYWDGEGWYADTMYTTPISPAEDGIITWHYDETKVIEKTILPLYGEGGGT